MISGSHSDTFGAKKKTILNRDKKVLNAVFAFVGDL